jgi:ceramide glucosyltransferase
MVERIADILLILSGGGLFYILLATLILVVGKIRSRRERIEIASFPPVTVLKPLKGIDDRLEDNLRSFFNLDYPQYELIFGVADADDPAIDIVRRLQGEYPYVDARLIIDDYKIGLNPKASNLNNMYKRSKFDLLIINDSNIRVNYDYLKDMVINLGRPGVGLVTSTIRGIGNSRLGSLFENLHLNSYIASSAVMVNNLIGIPVSIGKSIAIKREVFERLGGFEELCDFLQEDELLSRKVERLGLRNHISYHCVDNYNCGWRLVDFISRHQRWATMRRHFKLYHYIFEPLSNPLFLATIGLILHPANYTIMFSALIFTTKIMLDFIASKAIDSDLPPYHFMLVPFKDIVIGAIWFFPFIYSGVKWRGKRYRVSRGTRLVAVEKARFSTWGYRIYSVLLNFSSVIYRVLKLFPKAKSYRFND